MMKGESKVQLTLVGARDPLQRCDIVIVLTHRKSKNSHLSEKRRTKGF